MFRRIRDAIALGLALVYGHHILVGLCRLWLSWRGLGRLPEGLVVRLAREYADQR